MTRPLPTRSAAEQRILDDFRYFLKHVWKHLGMPEPTWVQYSMAHFLQHGERRRGLLAFRGVGKSYITVAFVVWLLLRDPDTKVLVVSASKDRADDFTKFVLDIIGRVPMCQHLMPSMADGQRVSRVAFDVAGCKPSGSPSVKSKGITSAITGSRADYIIADDVEIPNNSLTQTMRDKLAHAVKEFDAILKPGGHIIYLGTPQTQNSIYNTLMGRGYVFRIWPIMFPTNEQLDKYGPLLSPDIRTSVEQQPGLATRPTEPMRFHEKEIAERLLSYGAVEFARQFMLDTRLADGIRFPLRLADLIVMDVHREVAPDTVLWASGPGQILDTLPNVGMDGDRLHRPLAFLDPQGNPPRMCPFQGRVMAIDPGGRGADETAYAVVYMLHGMLFLMDSGGLRGGYSEENLTKLATIARDHKVNNVLVESNFGDGMFTALLIPYLKRYWPVSTEEVRSNLQKERRICDTLEPIVQQHRLIVDSKLFDADLRSTEGYPDESSHNYQLWYQFTRVTRERGALRHDDRLDALAMAVAHFVTQLSKEVGAAADESREIEAAAQRQAFMDRVDRKRGDLGWRDNWNTGVCPGLLQR